MEDIGFVRVAIKLKDESREYIQHWMPGSGAEDYVVAAEVIAKKPSTLPCTVYNAFKFIGDLAYDAWRAQARHHALHTDAPRDEALEAPPGGFPKKANVARRRPA